MDKILLFIPMYNCEKQIVRVLAQLKGEAAKYISQVIVVNNRSTDNGEQAVINWLEENRLSVPVSLSPKDLEGLYSRRVGYTDLDRNGHMNNTRYLEWMDDLLTADFHRENHPKEINICYHAEAREGQTLHLHWQLSDEKELLVDALRQEPEDEKMHHVFAAKVQF